MEIVRYLIQKTPIGTMMKPNAEGNWVEASDFDRVTAERDALQLRLNAVEEENDRLRTLLRSMTCSYREAITNGHERITFLGGECDSPERMLNDNPNYAKSWEALEKRQ